MVPFDRRYVLIPVLASVALVMVAYFFVEAGRVQSAEAVRTVQGSQNRLRTLLEVQSLMTDAETGQRGYVLTGDESYLQPYDRAKEKIQSLLSSLSASYSLPDQAEMQPSAMRVIELSSAKFTELDSGIALYRDPNGDGPAQALNLVKTNLGQATMSSLRDVIGKMRRREDALIDAQTANWLKIHTVTRVIAASGAALNIFLILLAGYLVSKSMQRRTLIAADLESQVNRHTRDLSELSTHLQRISETEKSSLARELHDELGGLLVGIKMDLAQLRSRLDLEQPDVKKRWDRIQALLSTGIDLKRRVIEQLRPSLLDNMGVIAAIHWQVGEICGAAGMELSERYPQEEPDLNSEAAIAIFRVAQESLTNIVKHAQATRVTVEMKIIEDQFNLSIEDNGIGLPMERWSASGSHGISGMRHRLLPFQGVFKIDAIEPKGTRISIRLPMARVAKLNDRAA